MKKLVCISLCFIILCSSLFLGHINNKVYADPFTAAQIGAASFAAMSSWGISFTSGAASSTGMGNFMGSQVERYVNSKGGTIASVFGSQMAIDAAGKLMLGQQMYNAIIEFKDWLINAYDLSQIDLSLSQGSIDGFEIGKAQESSVIDGYEFVNLTETSYGSGYRGAYRVVASSRGQYINSGYSSVGTLFTGSWYLGVEGSLVYAYLDRLQPEGRDYGPSRQSFGTVDAITDSLTWNGADYVAPTVLNPNKEWIGDIGGYSVPDTNLDQLLGNINEAVADNNLIVDGEVIDVPIPVPTPVPIDPDTPLSDVPWEGLDTNLIDLYNQGLEEIGAIGEAQDAITDAVAEQTGTLEGAIADNAGVVSGAIDQAVSDIQDAIGDQTAALDQSLTTTAEGVETIAEALEDETIDWQKFDLRGLFPFCIPFDIYNMLEALDASPTAPHVQLPFIIESIGFSYTIDLDFSSFDQVASVMRTMELIVYGIALAWATSKVIKW